jgi:hypothetical protein
MRPVQEDAVASDEAEEDEEEGNDDTHTDEPKDSDRDSYSRDRMRGIIFGRSVRSSYCCLHVARFLQVKEPSNDNDNNDEDDEDEEDNLEPIMIRLHFQNNNYVALRSYCRRMCKLGDLLELRGTWKQPIENESIQTDWQSPRLVVNLTSLKQAQAVLKIITIRYWTMPKCQSWQNEYLSISPWQGRGGREGGGVVVDVNDNNNNEDRPASTTSATTTSATTTSATTTSASAAAKTTSTTPALGHGGALGKRTQGDYVTNFLIHMIMNMNTPSVSVSDETTTTTTLTMSTSTACAATATDPSTWATLDPRTTLPKDNHNKNANLYSYRRAIEILNAGTGVVDAAGGSGHVSMALGMAGIHSTVVDPRESVGKLPGRDRKIWNRAIRSQPPSIPSFSTASLESIPFCQPVSVSVVQYDTMRAWFGAPPVGVDESFRHQDKEELPVCAVDHALLSTCSAIIALHPDEATDAIVDTAVALRIPFVIVPCCVFFRLFPHRRKPNSRDPVSSYEDLLEYLMAKDETIQRTDLPFAGSNTVLWSRF